MGRGVGTAVACAAAALAASAAAAHSAQAAIGCAETSTARVRGTHVLLGAVVLSPARDLERRAQGRRERGWSYFLPARIAIRDGEPDVALGVPLGWRQRVASSWGRGGPTAVARFARCSGERGWTVFEGGFHLRGRADCVPLMVRVGGASTTVRLGLGRSCGATGRA